MKKRYFLKLAYNGANYFGWQRQPKQLSVQEVLEDKLCVFLRESIAVVGAGRTDTGVHAKEYVAHFDAEEIADKEAFIFRMNSFLPKDIALYDIIEVRNDAHARFDAQARSYEYRLTTGKNPFNSGLSYQVYREPDISLMNEAAIFLVGRMDFECFSRTGSDVKTFICDVREAFWKQEQNNFVFTITADRFLRNMVRAIVGTLLEIGYQKISVSDIKKIVESKNRSNAGPSAPANGLFLTRIQYPDSVFIK